MTKTTSVEVDIPLDHDDPASMTPADVQESVTADTESVSATSPESVPAEPGEPTEAPVEEPEGDSLNIPVKDEPKEDDFNLGKYQDKFTEKGELEESDYKELEAAGYPKELVETYIAGYQALNDQRLAELVYEPMGGKAEFNKMLSWAAENMPAEWVTQYNETVDSKQADRIKFAAQSLQSAYNARTSARPTNQLSGRGSASGVQPFQSQDEIVRAMSDPRYDEGDPAYHREIEERLRVTNL